MTRASRPRNMPPTLLPSIAAAAIVAVLAIGCGKGSSDITGTVGTDTTTTPTDTTPKVDAACVSPTLVTSSAQPFDTVEITGITGITDSAWVTFESESGTSGVAPIFVDASGHDQIVVPPDPDDLMGGGALQLAVTDGSFTCKGIDLEVAPVQPASGDPLGKTVVVMDSLTAAFAAELGLDTAQVASTSLADLPPEAVPVALLLEGRAAFDQSAALGSMSEDEVQFTQALLAKLDVAGHLGEMMQTMPPVAPVTGEITAEETSSATGTEILTGGTSAPGSGGSPFGGMSSSASTASRTAIGALTGPARTMSCSYLGTVPAQGIFDVSTPQKLSEYVKSTRGWADISGPLAKNIADVNEAFGVLGLISPGVGKLVGWVAYLSQLLVELRANLYPSAISRVEYKLDPLRIEEDWDTSNGDPEIRWSFAKLYATNNGMNLIRAGIDLITTKEGIPSGFKGRLATAAVDGLDFVGKNALNHRLDELGKDPDAGSECWGIGPTEFGPSVVPDDSGDKWVDAGIIDGEALEGDATDIRHLTPVQIGHATVHVTTQPGPFPGPIGIADKDVEVVRKQVVWHPTTLIVENPGETATVSFIVVDSRHHGPGDVKVTAGPNLPDLTPTYANDVHTITFQTPDSSSEYPTWIDAASTSKELPPSDPARMARLDIVLKKTLKIAPRQPCVPSGKSQTFTAEVGGITDPVVHWEIESGEGTLSASTGDAVDYHAPGQGSGQVTLHAWVEDDSGGVAAEDRVTFRYGKCTGLAAYYSQNVSLTFPYGPGGACNNPDLGDDFQDFTLPSEGIDPLVRPATADLWINRTENYSQHLQNSGNLGTPRSDMQGCIYGTFAADAGFDATLTGSEDGSRLDIDIATDATSNGVDMGEFGTVDAFATATMSVVARFDFDLPQAADYQLTVDLTGSLSDEIAAAASGTIRVMIFQVEPDGTLVQPNASTLPIEVTYDDSNPTVSIDRLMSFNQPSQPDQVDHGVVVFTAANLSNGAQPGDLGEIQHSGYLRGYVSVTPK